MVFKNFLFGIPVLFAFFIYNFLCKFNGLEVVWFERELLIPPSNGSYPYLQMRNVLEDGDVKEIIQYAQKQDYALFVSLNEAQNISEEWSSEPIDGKCILPKAMRDDGRCHFINRFDAGMHQSRTGGYHQRKSEKLAKNNARGVVFRQTLSYGNKEDDVVLDKFFQNPVILDHAKQLCGPDSIVRPYILYANIMLPGQELPAHSDTPAFRGLDRFNAPHWFLSAMHASGLFKEYHVDALTAVTFYSTNDGGDFVFWPGGPKKSEERVPCEMNTGIIVDTDTVIHFVDVVGANVNAEPPPMKVGVGAEDLFVKLRQNEEGKWDLLTPDGDIRATYDWDMLRYSVSWKGICFENEEKEKEFDDKTNEITIEQAAETMKDFLVKERGRSRDELDTLDGIAKAMATEFVHPMMPAFGGGIYNLCVISAHIDSNLGLGETVSELIGCK